jgi:outer membrane protein assembly factor BamB
MKKIIGFIICILLILASSYSVLGINEEKNKLKNNSEVIFLEELPLPTGLFDWPMFRYGLNNSGFSPSPSPDDNTTLWSKDLSWWLESNPTLKDERLFIMGIEPQAGGYLYCLNPFTGGEIWNTSVPEEVFGSPTVVNDRVYVLGMYISIYCYDANTGEEIWSCSDYSGHCSPLVVNDKVYFGTIKGGEYLGGFHCHNATNGDLIWDFEIGISYEACSPAYVDGKVYIGNDDGIFYCLDAENGDEIWNYSKIEHGIWSSPSVYNDKVYFAVDKLYCLNASNGVEIWNVSGIITASSPAVAYGKVYIGNGYVDGKFYCFDPDTGDEIWHTRDSLGPMNWIDPAIADEKIYIVSDGNPGKFNCLDAYTGDIIWQFDFNGSGCFSSPAIAYGNAYVGSITDGYLYAFGIHNERPNTPQKPEGPSEGDWYVEYTFNSSTTDPEGNQIHYLFDWDDGTNSGWIGPYASGKKVSESHSWTKGGDYKIRVKAHDGRRESNWSDPLTISIIEENLPPYKPSNPIPTNNSENVSIYADLKWDGGDPNSEDTVVYDIYFGTTSPPPLVAENITEETYDPGTMEIKTMYYWQIIAEDSQGLTTEGQIWNFKTEEYLNEPPTPPDIDGPEKGIPDTSYEYGFTSFDPESHDIAEYIINWGGDTSNETITGPFGSGVEVFASHSWSEKGTFTIKAKAIEISGAESNWSEFNVKIPRTRASFNPLFYWLWERFPLLEKLLNIIF